MVRSFERVSGEHVRQEVSVNVQGRVEKNMKQISPTLSSSLEVAPWCVLDDGVV
jgi:hypothetical protein